jgi:hypothetical protein
MGDINDGYKKVQDKINTTKSYTNLKTKYDGLKKNAGTTFDQKKSDTTQSLNNLKEQTKSYQKELKNQFEQLLDISSITGGKSGNSIKYVKTMMTKVLHKLEPKIAEILYEECLTAVGCDQEQTFASTSIYVKVKSVDIGNLLKKDPNTKTGKLLYEKSPISVQGYPFSMNKELYRRIERGNDYQTDNAQLYFGGSGQPLFNIQYVELDSLGQTGPWFKVDLQNRASGVNNVSEFIMDYYKSIKVVDFHNIISWIIEMITGAISISGDFGINQVEDTTKAGLIMQRILGLCFDSRKTIDVSGVSKLSEYDTADDSFYEFTDIDLRKIDDNVNNIKNGVMQFVTCDDVKLPVNAQAITDSLSDMIFVEGNKQVSAADEITKLIASDPNWGGLALNSSLNAELDLNFVKSIVKGLAFSLLSPKVLLPIFVMLKAIGQNISDTIKSFYDFIKKFKSFFKNLISKIGAIFVKELFKYIKKDIKNLIQSVIIDLAKEKADKKIIMILKLVQLLITVAQFIKDWRECKSVIDELLWLLKMATSGWGGELSLPLLFASQLLDGFSATRAFMGVIEELQKIGIPTGDMPDGSPNLTVLTMFSQVKAQANEMAENGKLQVAIPPLTMTPAGLTIPASGFGKSI